MEKIKTAAAIIFTGGNYTNIAKNVRALLAFNEKTKIFILNASSETISDMPCFVSEHILFINKEIFSVNEGLNYIFSRAEELYDFEYFLCLDEKGIAKFDMLKTLISTSKNNNDNCIVEALQFPVEEPKIYNKKNHETPWCSQKCLLIPKHIFSKVSGFDEYLSNIPSSADFSWRVKQTGAKCIIEPRALYACPVSDLNEKETLKSTYLLARKYKNKKCEQNYFDALKKIASEKEIEELKNLQIRTQTNKYADFSKGLYFAKRRF